MALTEFNLIPRTQNEPRAQAASHLGTDDDRLVLHPFLVLPSGVVELKDSPRVIFAAIQEFACIE